MLKLQEVFDKDMISADDSMGDAEVDFGPLIAAAHKHERRRNRGGLQMGKVIAKDDNALVEDSIISLTEDGKAIQELLLKLQNVESGILKLQLEWIPLNQ